MKVREVMTTDNVSTVGESDSLAAAAHRMTWTPCRHLPVVKDREVVGVLSERDLLAWIAEVTPGDLLGHIVAEMYTPPLDRG